MAVLQAKDADDSCHGREMKSFSVDEGSERE